MKNFLFLIAPGNKSTEAVEIKKYIGVGSVSVLAVNPNKAQIKELMGYEPQEEPVYTGVQEVDGKQVNYARVDFIVKVDSEKHGIDYVGRMTYFIRNQYRKGSQSGKYLVLDAYNNSAWATEDTIKNKGQVMYSNGPAKIIGAYRPAYNGEYELTNFIRQYLVIGSAGDTNGFDYINGTWVEKTGDALKECECSFSAEEIQKMFKGDFSAIKDAIALQPNNKVKVLFGVRNTDDGKEYQDIYTATVLRNSATSYSKLQEKVEEVKNNGGLSNRTYEFCELKEYKPTPTDFGSEVNNANNDPFANAASNDASPW
jgi:hypothetical protein